ncbi:uncharacterized protein LOC142493677 [Ascaphus truei]|uniref:uncharacterized protein LOC142493677 n=1 Tax=Ascaphus truei TaxID=8439 RepID=UPI003F59EB12
MDFNAREQERLKNADEIFFMADVSHIQASTLATTVGKDNIKLLNALMRKRARVWWNKTALERYLDHKLIPRGLRIKTFPAFQFSDPNHKVRWEGVLNQCSFELMSILIEHDSNTFKEVSLEIEEIQKNLEPNDLQFVKIIEEDIVKYETEITDIKKVKFNRDSIDYQTDKVYNWQQGKRIAKKSRPRSVTNPSAISGAPSTDIDSSDYESRQSVEGDAVPASSFLGQGHGQDQAQGGQDVGSRQLRDRIRYGYRGKKRRGNHAN